MSAVASSPSRPYVSRRKRRLFANDSSLLGNRFLLGLLGLLVVVLLVSLGIIATHLLGAEPSTLAGTTASPPPSLLQQ